MWNVRYWLVLPLRLTLGTMRRLTCAFLYLALLAALGPVTSAATIQVTGVDSTRGEYGVWLKADGVDWQTYFAGVLWITVTSDNSQFDRDTLCVDLFTNIYIGNTYATSLLHSFDVSGKNLERVSWLIDNALLPTQSSYSSDLPANYWITSPDQGAGVQFAIWDIVHDNGDGFSDGRVQASAYTDPNVLNWAEQYLSLSAGRTSALANIYLNTELTNRVQVQMLAGPQYFDGGPMPAPEPATMILVGAALIAAAVFMRKKAGSSSN